MKSWVSKFRKWAKGGQNSPDEIEIGEKRLAPIVLPRLMSRFPAGQVLVAVADTTTAEEMVAAWEIWRQLLGDKRPAIIVPDVALGRRQWLPENEASRCAALQEALTGTPALYVATANTLLSQTLSPKGFAKQVFTLKVGQNITPEALAQRLVELDYDNEFEVGSPGEFARRGGIMDIFSPLYPDPVRVEFWGDEIDSLRFFSASSQCSTEKVREFRVIPRGSAVLESADTQSVRDYFAPAVPLILCNPLGIEEHLAGYAGEEKLQEWQQQVERATNTLRVVLPSLVDLEEGDDGAVDDAAARSPKSSDALGVVTIGEELNALLPDLDQQGVALWHWQQLKSELKRWNDSGYQLVACCAGDGECQRFQEMLQEDPETRSLPIELEHQALPAGLLFPKEKLALLSDQELFGRENVRRHTRHIDYNYEHRDEINELLEMEVGSYAVHVTNGICIYHGIKRIMQGAELSEVIELEFADDEKLYVPLDNSYLVSRYMGGTKNVPKLSKVGGISWRRNKEKAESAAMDLASELLRIAAFRATVPGFQFAPVPEYERAFSSSFPYSLTADQEAALEACFQDMAAPKPMDRLLCGDVGYGKTEVAMRAAFRAVMNGKQVAVMVPTTVLAQQHYETFRARLAEFPVTVEMLSRFRSRKEQNETIAKVAAGEVDIVIGTHRIISKDVKFANLGLYVIDEEQRFGVSNKDKLKSICAGVDILTMSATPIPRTLYLSLSGLRNLSTIMTAPAHRLPVTTIVANYDVALIREAIMREMERGGQVFLLHNRVQTIAKFRDSLQAVMPEVRFTMGHGQMQPGELEKVMTNFIARKSDVLICTTIIESGVDIPNVNAIIIDGADKFGLSELYQLRGRVGRSFRQAYAYMLLPPMGLPTTNAKERLAAIKRFTHLGSGFRLAMKDLEIRGTGNILGEEQSGHIAAVGFDLYCQLLKIAVSRLEQQPQGWRREVPVEIDFLTSSLTPVKGFLQAVIQKEYIADESTRLNIYRKIQVLDNPADVDALSNELRDRFGPLPAAVQALLQFHRIRTLAISRNWVRLNVKQGRVIIETQNGIYKINGKIPQLVCINPQDRLTEIELIANKCK